MIETNENKSYLAKIDYLKKEITNCLSIYKNKSYAVRSWDTNFNQAWNKISQQLNWPNKNTSQSFRPRTKSPILNEENLELTFHPNLTTYTTSYEFKLCSSGEDSTSILATGHYIEELTETILLYRLIPYIKSFIDVGANIGFYSILVAWESKGNIPIIAFEPEPRNIRAIKKSMKSNNLTNCITIVESAIGEIKKKSTLKLCPIGSGGHSLSPTVPEDTTGEINVSVETLDNVYNTFSNLMNNTLVKIDIEGYEINALKGASSWLSQKKNAPIILIEAWPQSSLYPKKNHIRTLQILMDYGYKIFAIQEALHQKTLVIDINKKNIHYCLPKSGNYIAIPEWANKVIPDLKKPIDLRLFSTKEQLQRVHSFLEKSHHNLKHKIQNLKPETYVPPKPTFKKRISYAISHPIWAIQKLYTKYLRT